jgi:hypothetical protein
MSQASCRSPDPPVDTSRIIPGTSGTMLILILNAMNFWNESWPGSTNLGGISQHEREKERRTSRPGLAAGGADGGMGGGGEIAHHRVVVHGGLACLLTGVKPHACKYY